jgi:hypothetical protein
LRRLNPRPQSAEATASMGDSQKPSESAALAPRIASASASPFRQPSAGYLTPFGSKTLRDFVRHREVGEDQIRAVSRLICRVISPLDPRSIGVCQPHSSKP